MTTFVHGKFSAFSLGDATQVLYDVSGISNSADFSKTIGTGETSHFGSIGKEFIVGLTDGQVSLSGSFDATIDGKISAAIDAMAANTIQNIPFQYSPAGTGTGNPKYTGNMIITNYTVSSPIGGVVTLKLTGQVTGASTRGVF